MRAVEPTEKYTIYDIRNAEGRLVAMHHRVDKPDDTKQVWWEKDGSKGLNGTSSADLPLYGSEVVGAWPDDQLIVLVEGEKARDALEAVEIPALGTVTGASGTPGQEALEVLRGREVTLWPDNDEAGREHMRRIAERLLGMGCEVRWYEWSEAPEKGDAADHPATQSGDAKAVDRLLNDLMCARACQAEESNDEAPAPVGQLLSEVTAERVRWLWEKRVPLGKLTVLDGDPGLGKSVLTLDAAARVSVGSPLPDGAPCEPGGVVLLNAEDGLADTILPRLEAAGGDPSKVLSLAIVADSDGQDRHLSIPEDIPTIERGIERVNATLVVIDPLMAFLSANANAHKDQDVRKALAPLAAMAERTGAAVVIVRHLNKAAGGDPLYRGGGSIGIIGAARVGLLVARDPDDEDRRVLAPLKNNLSKPAPSLAFALAEAANCAARVEWKGETSHTASTLLATPVDPEERSALDEAKEFLRDALGDGLRWSRSVETEAREAGISNGTLKRAKQEMGVRSNREADGWYWQLPASKGIKGGQAPVDDPLEPLEPLLEEGMLSADQGEQGDQEAHELRASDDERLALGRNGHLLEERCIHDVPSGCWLCKNKTSEDSEESVSEATALEKPSREEQRR